MNSFFWTLTYSLFVPFGVKLCLLFVVYKLCYIKSRSSPFFKSCHPSPYCCWSTVYSFTKRRNKPGFSGFIKIPIEDNMLADFLTVLFTDGSHTTAPMITAKDDSWADEIIINAWDVYKEEDVSRFGQVLLVITWLFSGKSLTVPKWLQMLTKPFWERPLNLGYKSKGSLYLMMIMLSRMQYIKIQSISNN